MDGKPTKETSKSIKIKVQPKPAPTRTKGMSMETRACLDSQLLDWD